MNLFTYGTLVFPEVWERIGIGSFTSEPATLPGFAIYRLKNAVFPGILRAEPHDKVVGRVYYDLTEDALFELDAYESDLYDRIPVIAASDTGPVECTTFVIPEARQSVLSKDSWDAKVFQEKQLEKFLHG